MTKEEELKEEVEFLKLQNNILADAIIESWQSVHYANCANTDDQTGTKPEVCHSAEEHVNKKKEELEIKLKKSWKERLGTFNEKR